MTQWIEDPDDRLIFFYTLGYKDFERASWHAYNRVFPYTGSRHVLQLDGDDDPRYQEIEQCDVRYGERLYLEECGGQLLKRTLEAFLEGDERWMLRVDTDTFIYRRFNALPEAMYFGTRAEKLDFIQGGCIGLHRDAAERVLDSGKLDDPALCQMETYAPPGAPWIETRREAGLLCQDHMLSFVLRSLGIKAINHPEIKSFWRESGLKQHLGLNPNTLPAIMHPVKRQSVERPVL